MRTLIYYTLTNVTAAVVPDVAGARVQASAMGLASVEIILGLIRCRRGW